MKIGIYSGMYDPLHNGHLWVIEQACSMFDQVHVVIGTNPNKNPMFTDAQRLTMLSDVTNCPEMCKTTILQDRNVVEYASKIDAHVTFIRGIRDEKDFRYESRILKFMRTIADVRHIYVVPPFELQPISSSLIKQLCDRRLWHAVKSCVPPNVYKCLVEKYNDSPVEVQGDHDSEFQGYEPNVYLENQRKYFGKAVSNGLFAIKHVLTADQVSVMLDEVPFEVIVSERFHLRHVPVNKLVPTGDRYLPCSQSLGPIIVDATHPDLPDRLKRGPALIIEGKHRWLDAVERNDKFIFAWVGEKVLDYFDRQ